MRPFAFAFIFLVSTTSLLACPNLAGQYKECRSTTGNSAGSSDMVVNQNVQNRITTYVVSATNNESGERETENYRADGKIKVQVVSDPDSGMSMETATQVICSGNSLHININVKFMGEPAGYSKVKVSKNESELYIDSEYFDGEEVLRDREICK